MLSYSLGFETVDRWSRLDGRGLSDDFTEGVCAQGANFLCNTVNGLFSCRPCTSKGLADFKALQTQINRLIVAQKLPLAFLQVDGRIGSKTVTALGVVVKAVSPSYPIPMAGQRGILLAMSQPTSEEAAREVAKFIPTYSAYAKSAADAMGAPAKPPVATSPPKDIEVVPVPTPPEPPKRRTGLIIGSLAAVTAIGLVAAAVQIRRS
jgi:hypothetical protein